MFKLTKVKGGNVAYMKKMSSMTKKGSGTPAIKKLPEQDILDQDEILVNYQNETRKGKGVSKYKKSIRPLQFKL